jgi:glycosyltransferase involved in cell wall biosynthesis
MEAAACGAPVIAYASGALPEIVRDGVTGFIVSDPEDMARAIERTGEINPAVCRKLARRCFDVGRMTSDYLHRYGRISRELAAA